MIPIVFATDHNFVMPTCVTILSLLKSAEGTRYDINIILSPDVTESDKELIRLQVSRIDDIHKVNFLEIGSTFDSGYEIRGISKACYNRLMIPWLLPQYDKVIYSDVDVIIKKSLQPLFDISMEGNFVAGVGGEEWYKGSSIRRYMKKIGTDPKTYINSGLILINSKLQREGNLRSLYMELVKKKFIFQDQDIINIICKGKIKLLSPFFNVTPSKVEKYGSENISVIHYAGLKPWEYFTYCWTDWWTIFNESVVYNPSLNYKISSLILGIGSKAKIAGKLIKGKLKFYLKLYGLN